VKCRHVSSPQDDRHLTATCATKGRDDPEQQCAHITNPDRSPDLPPGQASGPAQAPHSTTNN
ncbi:Hypothetical predicted protein, partial [Pelobates cultripes]